MFGAFRNLRDKGVLAINKRNADYMLPHNPRNFYPLVDDKVRTKQLAKEHGIPVPELYGIIEVEGQVHELDSMVGERSDFVIKPAHGSGGEGILVISGRPNNMFRKADGLIIAPDEVNHHLFNLLSGLYSLGGQPDRALIEYRVKFDPLFEKVSYQGVPDIRIIAFLCVPVMSMVRLPTRMSDGKANLHQGAVGAGIDLASGTTLAAVWNDRIVFEHPETGHPVSGLTIPGWDKILEMAARCCEITGLGYQGVDIVLDRDKGPLLLEINARPGLNIQIANNAGLLPRLDLVEQWHSKLTTTRERIDFAREHFKAA